MYIDVLIVFDNPQKPYYLTNDDRDKEKNVRANFIYTRTNDTNTPIDKSADIGVIEKMWSQRFGIDLPPLERMKMLLLQPEDWFKDIGNKSYSFNKTFPEYRIEFSDVSKFWEVYSFFFTNESSYLGTATFKYHSTTLFELEYMYCDEMRINLAVPKTAIIKLEKNENWFYYYILEELDGIFLQFLTNKLSEIESRGSGFPFVILQNQAEKDSLIEYVMKNEDEFNNIEASFLANHAKDRMSKQNKSSVIDPIFVDKVTKINKTINGRA